MRDSSTAASSSCTAADSKPLIESWLRSVGIWWDEGLVQIRSGCSGCSGPNLGVFAVTDITENQLLCVIPRAAILSPRTTRLAAVLEQERVGGGLALTIAVMYEASLGPDSKWAGYLASLPRREYLPVFWTDAELALLQGTSLEGRAAADRQDTQEDYETFVLPLLQKYPEAFPHPELCGLDAFRVAASWVASRCFCVDDWHGDAMVPLADIFNHKASVVLLDDAWGVAELAGPHGHDADEAHSQDESSEQQDDSGDDVMEATGHNHSHRHGAGACGSDCPEGEHHHEADSEDDSEADSEDDSADGGEDGSEAARSGSDSEEGSEDAQHGFAVGGMPIISAAATEGRESGPARWVRDGINLRLEIGICSMGPPDSRKLPPTPGTAAAAAAAAAAADTVADSTAADSTAANSTAAAAAAEAAAAAAAGDHGDAAQQQPAKRHKADPAASTQPVQHAGGQAAGQQKFPEQRLEIIAASAVAAGAEVHNTYGELGNAQLVAKYGFCLPHNPFDEITLCGKWTGFTTGSSSSSGVADIKPPAKLKQHIKWLQKHSNLLDDVAEDEEAPDPPQITPGGRLNLMTAAVVRLLGASSAQLKSWQGLEDVLQNPESNTDDAPAAVPLHSARSDSAAAAAGEGEAKEVSAHFDDVKLNQRPVSWWGRAGLELLASAVQRRLQQYPCSIEADRLALQQQQQQAGANAVEAAEHSAATAAALQLRVCEQEALHEVLAAVQELLS